MAGQALTSGQGSVGRGVTLALVGIALTLTAGNLGGSVSGQQFEVSQGTVVQSISVAVSGSEITSAAGTLTPQTGEQRLVGQGITSASGSVYPSGNDVTVNISGVEAAFVPGVVDAGGQPLSGSAITSAAGTPVYSLSLAITGIESVSAAGTISPGIDADDTYVQTFIGSTVGSFDVALTGSGVAVSAGTMITQDGEEMLTGQASTSGQGTAAVDVLMPITGQEITTAQSPFGAPGMADLTGSAITVSAGDVFTTNDRTYALTGQSITVGQGNAVTSYLAFATGQVLTVSAQEIGPRAVALTGEQVGVGQGDVTGPATTKYGKSSKKKKRDEPQKMVVSIDGEDFVVESKEAAEALLRQAKETYAEQVAEVDRQARDRTVKVVKPLKMPRIRAVGPESPERDALIAEVAALRKDMKALHEQAMESIRKYRNDEDEAIALLL